MVKPAEAPLRLQQLTDERLLVRALIDQLPDFVFVKDVNSRFLVANNAIAAAYGMASSDDLIGKTDFHLHPAAVAQQFFDLEQEVVRSGVSLTDMEESFPNSAGVRKWYSTTKIPLRNSENKIVGLVGVGRDITERRQAESDLLRTREFLDAVVESMPAMLVVKEAREHRFVLVNKAGEELLGVSRHEMLGKTDYDFFPKEQADFFVARDNDVLRSGKLQLIPEEPIQTRSNGVRLLATKKLAIRDETGEPQYLLILCEDITERRAAEARIVHMAHHDALTGLANRVLLREYLQEGLARVQQQRGHKIAVVCLDLDDFKRVNDTFGHPFGDELLLAVAQRLRNCVREGDTVARLGGDEFAIVQAMSVLDEPAVAVSALASRILTAMAEPFELHRQNVVIETSIGVAVAPGDGSTSDQLLKNADIALYRAKADGRGLCRFFKPEMDARVQARRALESDLREALAKGELDVFYQPVVRISTGEVTGVEALVRWRHPTRGTVSPAEFIPIAEETGLIIPLGEWVLRQACAEVASWPREVRVAVNFSPVQFKRGSVPEIVRAALARSGLSPGRLEVEITETTLLQESAKTLATLNELRAMGVRVSMDDFGTGYSSLGYLRKYPFDKIKIDQSFVQELSHTAESQAIVRAVTGLGLTLGMGVTAEGVETEDQRALLQAAGCEEAQGFLFSQPVPAEEMRKLLAEWDAAAHTDLR